MYDIIMSNFENIMINRVGKNDSKMQTYNIIQVLSGNSYYTFSNFSLKKPLYPKIENNITEIIKPSITTITGIWDTSKMIKSNSLNEIDKMINMDIDDVFSFDDMDLSFSSEEEYQVNKLSDSNILGDNVLFKCEFDQYYFKPIEATKETVAYYNCKLIDKNETFFINSENDLALFDMEISSNYIKDYIMDEMYGGGIYLEYHDFPHIYIPTDEMSAGYIMLAKKIQNNRYDVSAFKIPSGKALYIGSNVIHNDCFLNGNYHVAYGMSNKYSTAILRNDNTLVSFNFI